MPLYPALLTAACLCLAVLYRTRWRDYSLPARLARTEKAAGGQPRIAVVIPTADQGAQLAENLPDIFAQEYPDFEVIVADEGSTDDTPEVLEALRQQYDNLRTTSVPATSRYIDRRKLAIALGIRAAHAPWVVLTRADCAPVSRQWLATLARNFTDGTDLVQGYANYADNHTATARRAIYERLRRHLRIARSSLAGRPSGADGCNIAIRREAFLEGRGFAKGLTLPFGADDLLADTIGGEGRTALELTESSTVIQALPERWMLKRRRMYRTETARHMSRRTRLYRWRESTASWATYTLSLLATAHIAFRVADILHTGTYAPANLVWDIPLPVLLAAALLYPVLRLRKSTKTIGERRFGGSLPWYALMQPWRNWHTRLACRRHRREFVRPILPPTGLEEAHRKTAMSRFLTF